MAKELVWIDLEMTGLDPKIHKIIEIATIIKRCPNMANNDPSQYILKSLEDKATNGFIFAYALSAPNLTAAVCPLLDTMLVFTSMSTVFPEIFNPFAVSKAGSISEIFVTCIP